MKTGWKGALGKEAPEAGAAPMTAYATMVAVAVAAVAFIVNADFGIDVLIWVVGIAIFREVALLSLTKLAEAENLTHNELDDKLIHTLVRELRHPITATVTLFIAVDAVTWALGFVLFEVSENAATTPLTMMLRGSAAIALALRITSISTHVAEIMIMAMEGNADCGARDIPMAVLAWRYITLIICMFFVGLYIGVDLEHAVAGVGFGGVMIAFSVKEIVQDIFQFGFFFFDKPFRVGSTISFNGSWGHVEQVGLKNVRMRDFDGLLHIVPNSLVGNAHIVSVAPENTDKQRAMLIVELAATTTDEDLAKFTEVAKAAIEAGKGHHLVTARMRELTPYGFRWEVYFNIDKTIWTADQQSAAMIRLVAAVRKSGMRLANEARLAALEQSGARMAAAGADT